MSKSFTKDDLKQLGLVETSKGVFERLPTKKEKVAEKPKGKQKNAFKKKSPKGNKYNAQKVVEDGVKYDSKRELAFKHLLDKNGIKYKMQVKYQLQEGFRYQGKAIRAIGMVPDFVILKGAESVAICDVKGMVTAVYKLKEKMLKKKLLDLNHPLPVFTPRNKKQMQETIDELLNILNA